MMMMMGQFCRRDVMTTQAVQQRLSIIGTVVPTSKRGTQGGGRGRRRTHGVVHHQGVVVVVLPLGRPPLCAMVRHDIPKQARPRTSGPTSLVSFSSLSLVVVTGPNRNWTRGLDHTTTSTRVGGSGGPILLGVLPIIIVRLVVVVVGRRRWLLELQRFGTSTTTLRCMVARGGPCHTGTEFFLRVRFSLWWQLLEPSNVVVVVGGSGAFVVVVVLCFFFFFFWLSE